MPLTKLLNQHDVQHRMYADDTQLYTDFSPFEQTNALMRMEACIRGATAWHHDNGLILIESKTEAVLIRSSSLGRPDVCGKHVPTSTIFGIAALRSTQIYLWQVVNVYRRLAVLSFIFREFWWWFGTRRPAGLRRTVWSPGVCQCWTYITEPLLRQTCFTFFSFHGEIVNIATCFIRYLNIIIISETQQRHISEIFIFNEHP